MKLFDVIRSAGEGKIVATLASEAGVERDAAEQAMRAWLPELGRAIRRSGESGSGVPAVQAALRDERFARYLDEPAALGDPTATADGERVLAEVLDHGQRDHMVRQAAGAAGQSETDLRKMLPLVATLAMAAAGQRLREPTPEVPWFGTRQSDRFDAPLLNALEALFEHEDDAPPKAQ